MKNYSFFIFTLKNNLYFYLYKGFISYKIFYSIFYSILTDKILGHFYRKMAYTRKCPFFRINIFIVIIMVIKYFLLFM